MSQTEERLKEIAKAASTEKQPLGVRDIVTLSLNHLRNEGKEIREAEESNKARINFSQSELLSWQIRNEIISNQLMNLDLERKRMKANVSVKWHNRFEKIAKKLHLKK